MNQWADLRAAGAETGEATTTSAVTISGVDSSGVRVSVATAVAFLSVIGADTSAEGTLPSGSQDVS